MSSRVIVAVAGAVSLGVLAGASLPAGNPDAAKEGTAAAATPPRAGGSIATEAFSADKPHEMPVATMAEASTGSHSQVPLAP